MGEAWRSGSSKPHLSFFSFPLLCNDHRRPCRCQCKAKIKPWWIRNVVFCELCCSRLVGNLTYPFLSSV